MKGGSESPRRARREVAVEERLLLVHWQGGAAVRDGSHCTWNRAYVVLPFTSGTPSTETTNRDMPAKARQHSTRRQQQVRECPPVTIAEWYWSGRFDRSSG